MTSKSLATLIVSGVLGATIFIPRPALAAQQSASSGAPAAPVTQTQVNFFTPAIPAGAPRAGSCWTSSIAVMRPGAWRCMIGNEIHDPCFQVPPHQGEVVCDANPATNHAGFVLKLTKPLPNDAAPPPEAPEPWTMLLADGSICEPFTGTMPMVGGEGARWFCFDPSVPMSSPARSRGLVTKINHAAVWTVDRYAESQAGPPGANDHRRVRAETVAVAKVWE
ncbi:MAG: hypothetical protein ACREQR_07525 [Candidatus Binataceae bacterium]